MSASSADTVMVSMHADDWTEAATIYDQLGRPELRCIPSGEHVFAVADQWIGGVCITLFPPTPHQSYDEGDAVGTWRLAMQQFDRDITPILVGQAVQR